MESSIQRLLMSAKPVRVHLVGAFGAGMRALAELLSDRGWLLTGSDMQDTSQVDSLNDRFVRIHAGHHAGHVPSDAQLVIYSPAIPITNPERVAAREQKITQISYDEMLAELTRCHRAFCVAGTHGKTTTTAMLATILRESRAPRDTGMFQRSTDGLLVLVGGELVQYDRSGWCSESFQADDQTQSRSDSVIVLESCEYQRHFLAYSPDCAVVLNVEPDHFDCFADLADAQDAFQSFAGRIAEDGLLLVNGDCPNSLGLADYTRATTDTFGFARSNDWSALASRASNRHFGNHFDVTYQGELFCSVTLNVMGDHNVLNALAAIALAHHAGVAAAEIASGISSFRGVRRRFELIGSRDGVTVISDYAHHPTAIKATIETARQAFPNRRIVCLFEPHQVSRTIALMSDFVDSLQAADDVTLAPIFAARENRNDANSVQLQLADELERRNTPVRALASLDQAVATLDDVAECGDVLLIMGAGNVDQIPKEFLANFDHLALR
jgi:UDP-N-acetylmuramate--alanine ligase